jgi:hypothetical protein
MSKVQRRKNRQCNRWYGYNTPASFARRSAGNDARRMAEPPPLYPADRPGGSVTGDYLDVRMYGQRVLLELRAPYSRGSARPRCETVSVWADGVCVIRATGKTGAFAEAMGRIAAPMSRKTIGAVQRGYSERDDMSEGA